MSWIQECTLSWCQSLCLRALKTGQVPKHVAFIMDGNRRYANKQNVATAEGHIKGFDKVSETLSWCKKLGITEVTIYAFSIENFKRSKDEVDDLMDLARQKFKTLLDNNKDIMENGVRICIIGNLSLLPEDLRKLVCQVMMMTKNNNKCYLNIAFAYTSRDDVTNAIKDITAAVKRTDILPEDINEDLISDCLYTYHSTNPDLLIRTSGEVRLSDFLMWQVSETCLYFSNILWPEFCVWDFMQAIFYYQKCYPDLKRVTKKGSLVKHNNRVDTYVDKLHHEREMMIENISLSAVQS